MKDKVKGLDTSGVLQLIKNVFRPDENFSFPKTGGLPLRGHRDDAKYHPEVADEAADSSHREQMALILRFIDKNMDIREEFIAFLQCKWGLSGENLAKLILDKLKDLGLPIEDCRGQGYDGAGAVAGCVKDIEVKKVLNKIKDVTNFINISQTRNIPFEETVRNSLETDSKKTRLPDVCRTRWVERVKGLDTFEELFVQIFDTLDNMAKGGSPSLAADASSLLEGLSEFHFIALLLLQGKSIDVMDGIELISSLKSSVAHVRNSIDSYHDQWYDIALTLAAKYYKRIYTIPLIDHLLSSLDARFDTESVNVYQGLSIVPTKMFSLIKNGIDWRHKFKIVSKFYVADLPNQLGLDAELLLWQSFWEHRKGPYPSNVATTLKAINFDGFQNIKVILQILGTLPITSCECERSISALRILKDYKRSTMVEERLNGLALMKIHQEILPDVQRVIDKFSVGKTRFKFN
ncbi:52 kDa repressor of the inhibitor of the protein kinase-like [Xenia sp. Carnegie-2017]|uniref:52 kDa repressor of the inhibitor of the protein kinase-like n=1 Tax=Xenia sp. Carnegie-2017 TaxID=2897299 RepID=UPI001F046FFA|nr:52 kDa repressor of the inhibitor of the protein kinase-like [Xenia sp. Carnegie-2017]